MPDNMNKRDGRDRNKVAGNEKHEVSYTATKTNSSSEEVRRAVKQEGNSREKVEKKLRGR